MYHLTFSYYQFSVVQRVYLDNIRPEYSRVYHIKESVASSGSSGSSSGSVLTTTEANTKGRFHYHEQFRDNEVRDAPGQKRQTKASLWPSENKKVNGELDQQQQLLMASSSSARPQYCLFVSSLLSIVVMIRKLS